MTLSITKPRVFRAHRGRRGGSGQVLPPQALERCADPGRARFCRRAAGGRDPAGRAPHFNGRTLHHAHGFAYSISPRKGGRRPELESLDTLEWIGRFLARIHTVGAMRPFKERTALNVHTLAPSRTTGWWSTPWCRPNCAEPGKRPTRTLKLQCNLKDATRLPRACTPKGILSTCRSAFACTATATPAIFSGHPRVA